MKYLIFCFFITAISCSNQGNKTDSVDKQVNGSLKKYLNNTPSYASYVFIPTDTLLFGFNKSCVNEDTSWTLMVSKSNQVIQCRYNQVLPYSATGFNDYLDTSKKLLYYEGFSFEIDELNWAGFVKLSGLTEYIPKDTIRYSGCPHCPSYTAYYNSQLIISGKQDNEYLCHLDSLLHKEILNSLFDKKLNPPIQFKKAVQ
jgi:hypothetical protein